MPSDQLAWLGWGVRGIGGVSAAEKKGWYPSGEATALRSSSSAGHGSAPEPRAYTSRLEGNARAAPASARTAIAAPVADAPGPSSRQERRRSRSCDEVAKRG